MLPNSQESISITGGMSALVISDSHGAADTLAALLTLLQHQPPDVVIFCGDGLRDIHQRRGEKPQVWNVRGNCDLAPPVNTPNERLERLGASSVLITHGHLYWVKYGLQALTYRALELQAQVVCFGHTHQPLARRESGVLLLNPGALTDGCYALLSMDEAGNAMARLCRLQG